MSETTTHGTAAESVIQMIESAKTNARRLALVGTVVIIAIGIASWLSYAKAQRPEQASFELMKAQQQSPSAIELVSRQYADTYAGESALGTLAAIAVQRTNYTEAVTLYRRLVVEHPRSYLVPAANLAIAQCYFAQGSIETTPAKRQEMFAQAETVLRRELLYNRDHYAAFSAQLALVHVLEAQGRHADAWNELRIWDQQVGNSEIAVLADGLRERLVRVTGAITNSNTTATQ